MPDESAPIAPTADAADLRSAISASAPRPRAPAPADESAPYAPASRPTTGDPYVDSLLAMRELPTEELVRRLDDPDHYVRGEACRILARRGPPPEVVGKLVDLVVDGATNIDPHVTLAGMGDVGLAALRQRLSTESDEHRRERLQWVIDELLGTETEPTVCPAEPDAPSATPEDTLRLLTSESEEDRNQGWLAAGRLRSELVPVVPSLLEALRNDPEDRVGLTHALLLSGAGDDALRVLQEELAEGGEPSSNLLQAVALLGPIARQDVERHLPEWLRSEDPDVLQAALWAASRCEHLADPATLSRIVAVVERADHASITALEYLSQTPEARSHVLHPLTAMLERGESPGRSYAPYGQLADTISVLGGLAPQDALRLLDDPGEADPKDVLVAIGQRSARPGDEVAQRLMQLAMEEDEPEAWDFSTKRLALLALERADAFAVEDLPRLAKLAAESEPTSANRACLAIGRFGARAAVVLPDLMEALRGGSTRVEWPLACIGPAAVDAAPRLALVARDGDPGCAFALGAIGAAALPATRAVLDGELREVTEFVAIYALEGAHDFAEQRSAEETLDAARAFLSLLSEEPLEEALPTLARHPEPDVAWAARLVRDAEERTGPK